MVRKTLQIHDTLSRSLQPVEPADGERLRFYCCGPTVYGPAHIGNFRTFLAQDLFRRVVELGGTRTLHVRNVTDVDDKTIRESQAAGEPLEVFTRRWLDRFHADARRLNLLEPHVEPGAAAHVPEQIALIETLVENGHAYRAADGSVYFRVDSFPGYGRLSRLEQRELKVGAGEHLNQADEYEKDSVADFALWKARKPEDGDNFWDSPWGEGRPGWHLECSAMGIKYLGESFDLHSGGVDLCFPHHENEIAQSEACTGRPFARLWFHIEHLMVDGRKMSKSLGNLHTLDDIAGMGFDASDLRYALLAGHYGTRINFSVERLREARGNLRRLADAAARLATAAGDDTPLPEYGELARRAAESGLEAGPFAAALEALFDDLNTPEALGRLFTALKPLEKATAEGTLPPEEAAAARDGLAVLVAAFGWTLPESTAGGVAEVPDAVRELAERRWAARTARDWATSDALRDELAALGWQVKDGRDGYELAPAGA